MLGNTIKKIRLSKNMGLNKTASLAGISGSYLSNIEKGLKENPSMEVLHKIANALNVPVNAFFEENPNIEKENNIKISPEVETIAAHLATKNITPKKAKLLKDYIDALFDEEF